MTIEIQGINKHFDSFHALQDINISIPTGGLVALLGPSGSGKSTLLRLIAGLENADSGNIYVDGKDFGEKRIQDRKVGFVFQHYALFKHMTIAENIAFGLKIRPRKERPSKKEINNRVEELLSLVQLSGLGDRFPSQLSGGQRQRIALARALAVDPEILLLDEPFGALDAKVRQELRQWLRELHDKLNITTIFVTHDQEEALEMADTVVVMDHGKVEQVGTPKEVYKSPETPFVYRFLGRVNAFPCHIENNRVKSGEVDLDIEVGNNVSNQEITGYIRPHEISVSKKITLTHSVFSKVCHVYYVGANIRMELNKVDTNDYFEVEMREEDYLKMGECSVGSHLFVSLNNMKLFLENEQVVKRGKVLTASG